MYDEDKAKQEAYDKLQEAKADLDLPGRAKFKRESPVWKGLLRSKGKQNSSIAILLACGTEADSGCFRLRLARYPKRMPRRMVAGRRDVHHVRRISLVLYNAGG